MLRALITCVLCLSAAHAAPAGDVISIEDGTGAGWQGAAGPAALQAPDLVGRTRAILRFRVPKGAGATWARPLSLDLSGAERIAVRLASPTVLAFTLRFRSGAGAYRWEARSTPGEQVLLIPLGAFEREGAAAGWERVEGIALELPKGAGTLDLVGIAALPEGAPIPGDDLFLYRPAVRYVSPTGVAWPIYAILTGAAPAKGGDRSPEALQKYLKQIYGVTLPVNPKGMAVARGAANVILIGREVALKAGTVSAEELERQGYSGFVVRADNGCATIAGETRHGTAYGTYRFLERQGCRFYGGSCESVPQKPERLLLAWELADKPFFEGQRLGGASYAGREMPGDATGAAGYAENQELFADVGWAWPEHTAGYLVPKAFHYDAHPEYYGLRGDGTRMPKETNNFRVILCTTHPDVLRISAERALRWIELQKERKFFSITQGDDHEWCACPRCKAMEYEPGNCSDRMLHWVNYVARAVAKKYPDKILTTYAYGPTQRAPVRVKPEKNVHIFYCAWPNATSAPCGIRDFDAPENALARSEIIGWLKVAPGQIGLYDYNAGGRYTLNGMAWRVKWAARHGLVGFHYCGINQSFRPLFAYVHSRLNWDPFLEVSNLKHEFIHAYYGKAAPIVEQIVDTIYDRIEYGSYDSRMQGTPPAEFYTRALVEQTLARFDAAAAMLPEDRWGPQGDMVASRALFIENCLWAMRPASRPCSEDELALFGICLKRYLARWMEEHQAAVTKAVKAGQKPPGLGGLADTLWNLARVRVEMDGPPDQTPPMVARLLQDPVATFKQYRVTNFVEKLPDGWRLPANAFTGGQLWPGYNWKCEPRDGAIVRGTMTEVSRMQAKLVLAEDPPERDGVLDIEGQDSDKTWCPSVPIQVWVNGRKLFEGENGFVKCGWSRRTLPLPRGVLRRGENVVEIRNLANTDSPFSHWVMISEVLVRLAR